MIELMPLSLVILYFLPFMVAAAREHESFAPIFVVNLLLGWTGIGWLFALVWASVMPARSAAVARPGPRMVREAHSTTGIATAANGYRRKSL